MVEKKGFPMRSSSTIFRLSTVQKVTTSGTSAATTNGFGAQTYAVRVHATKAAHIFFDGAPTATTNHTLMGDGGTEYFQVTPGQKLAAIQSSEAGVVYVTELTH